MNIKIKKDSKIFLKPRNVKFANYDFKGPAKQGFLELSKIEKLNNFIKSFKIKTISSVTIKSILFTWDGYDFKFIKNYHRLWINKISGEYVIYTRYKNKNLDTLLRFLRLK